MITVAIIAGLGALAGAANAAMDHLTHHHSQGPFARFGSDPLAFWGRPIYTWKRRYVHDADGAEVKPRRLRPFYRVPVVGWVGLMFVDAWHTMQSIMWLCLFAAVAVAAGAAWYFALVYAATLGTFTVAYRLLRG